jgi:lipopolysaccharide export system protein LptA
LRTLIAAAGCLCALAAPMIGSRASAQAFAGFNSNQPVDYAADQIELQDRQGKVMLTGNVDIRQGDMRLHAARMIVSYTNAKSLQIQRIDAVGGVTATRGGETARGDVGLYDLTRRVIVMSGNVALRRGTDTLNGGRLTIDLKSGVSTVDGRGGGGRGGRVSGTFSVPKN